MTIENEIKKLTEAVNRVGDLMVEVLDHRQQTLPSFHPATNVESPFEKTADIVKQVNEAVQGEEPKTEKQPAKKSKAKKSEPEPTPEADDVITAEALQSLCLTIVRNSDDKTIRAKVKDAIAGFGANTIPKVDSSKYGELKASLEQLAGGVK